ncbi:MAG TPA: hypothetical protein VHQ90_03710 [Thermoanaerobaculia bacterium]|nr:hypothetical protein [Thermoanaerobaculia bacterium]
MLEDIDTSRKVDLLNLDNQQRTVVNRVALALEDANDPNLTTAALLADILRTFLGTHTSVRLLLAEWDRRPVVAADAVSLVREQIEKVFLVSLLLSDWATYVPVYFEEDWCRRFRYFLVQKKERNHLERFREFFQSSGPELLEKQRRRLKISEDIRDLIEFQVAHCQAARPNHLKAVRVPRLPTPKAIVDRSQAAERPALLRWYEEYRGVCGYTHIGADKLQMTVMTGRKVNFSQEQQTGFFTKELVELSVVVSYIACAYTATELLSRTGGGLEPMAEVMKLWTALLDASLVAKVFWEARSASLLPLAGL